MHFRRLLTLASYLEADPDEFVWTVLALRSTLSDLTVCSIEPEDLTMNAELEKEMLTKEYFALREILERAGIEVIDLDTTSLSNMSQNDLRHIVHQLRDLARTPRD